MLLEIALYKLYRSRKANKKTVDDSVEITSEGSPSDKVPESAGKTSEKPKKLWLRRLFSFKKSA